MTAPTTLQGAQVKLSVGETGLPCFLEIEGLFTQGQRPGRTFNESVGGTFEMDSSDWLNGIRYHIFGTRPDTEFKLERERLEDPERGVWPG